MKEGWDEKPVTMIAEHSLGKMLDKNKNKGRLHRYLRNVNVRWCGFDLGDMKQMRFEDHESDKFTARKGDVLICEGGYPGRAAIWDRDEPIHFQKAVHRVRFHELERNTWFLYYLQFLDLSGDLRTYFTGTGIQHFTGRALAQLPVPLPPLAEQRRIVAILDEAFAGLAVAVENTKRNLASARELFESELNRVFSEGGEGWEEKRLGEICSRVSVGHVGETSSYYCDESQGVPFLRSQNVRPGVIDRSGLRFITRDFHLRLKKSALQPGDVLFVRVGANRGDCCFVPDDLGELNCANIVFARLSKDAPEYVAYYCQSQIGRMRLLNMTTGSAQGVINTKSVAELVVPLPTLSVQRESVKLIDDMKQRSAALENLSWQKLTDLSELKQSLLQKAFAGELTADFGDGELAAVGA